MRTQGHAAQPFTAIWPRPGRCPSCPVPDALGRFPDTAGAETTRHDRRCPGPLGARTRTGSVFLHREPDDDHRADDEDGPGYRMEDHGTLTSGGGNGLRLICAAPRNGCNAAARAGPRGPARYGHPAAGPGRPCAALVQSRWRGSRRGVCVWSGSVRATTWRSRRAPGRPEDRVDPSHDHAIDRPTGSTPPSGTMIERSYYAYAYSYATRSAGRGRRRMRR